MAKDHQFVDVFQGFLDWLAVEEPIQADHMDTVDQIPVLASRVVVGRWWSVLIDAQLLDRN